jgi:hypothetical protein
MAESEQFGHHKTQIIDYVVPAALAVDIAVDA